MSSAASGVSLELRFFLCNFSGVKRTCWTTGSWRSCLRLEVVSSIPAGSTINYWFLCGFIRVSLCQSIKIKPTNIFEKCNSQIRKQVAGYYILISTSLYENSKYNHLHISNVFFPMINLRIAMGWCLMSSDKLVIICSGNGLVPKRH